MTLRYDEALRAGGNGSPEGTVTADPGAIYLQRDGASGVVAWYKHTGSGNTGWGQRPHGLAAPAVDVELIAHRGFSNIAPENTLASLHAAIGIAHSLEGDVHFSSDGVAVMIHDDTVDRTCAPSTGTVSAMTLAALQALDAGAWFDSEWANTRIPTFADWLTLGGQSFRLLYPEIKGYRTTADIQLFAQAIIDAQLEDRCIVQSANGLVDFPILRQYSSRVVIGYITNGTTQFNQVLPYAKADGRAVIIADYTTMLANPSLVATARASGVDVVAWTVDQIEVARQLVAIGITRIMSSLLSHTMVAR